MTKVLIAILSCERDRLTHQAIRDTWLKDCPVDYRFLVGCQAEAPDELSLPVADDYEHVTDKSLAAFWWALKQNYDFVLHVGRDTYVNVPRLLRGNLEKYNYAGHAGGQGNVAHYCDLKPDGKGRYSYASGGAGSWLSARALERIISSPIYHKADDLLYGWVLGLAGIALWHDPRFGYAGESLENSEQFTMHLSKGTGFYNPAWMYHAHAISK